MPALTKAINLDKLIHHSFHVKKDNIIDKNKDTKVNIKKSADTLNNDEFQLILHDLFKLQHHSHHHHINNPFNSDLNNSVNSLNSNKNNLLNKLELNNNIHIWPSNDLTKERVYLWHKDTDPYSQDERIQSAGYYNEIKILLTSRMGCLHKIFDLRHDYNEYHNLYSGSKCLVNINNYSKELVMKVISKDISKAHCSSSTSSTSESKESSKDNSIENCMNKYYDTIISKIVVILPKLMAFIKYGNHGHQQYMNNDKDKAICTVPVAEQVKTLKFKTNDNCISELTCSVPEY